MTKIAIIGHMALDTNPLLLPGDESSARQVLAFQNFVRAVDGDQLIDHLQLLAKWRGRDERLSIWDIRLAAPLILGTHLRAAGGFEVRTLNSVTAATASERLAELKDFAPRIVVVCTTFMLTSDQFLKAADLVRATFPDAIIVAGGQHIYNALTGRDAVERAAYLADTGFDAVICDPQGEAALVAFCTAVAAGRAPEGIANLIWRDAGGLIHHGPDARENNDIDLSLADFAEVTPGEVAHVRTARSCSFKCAFCTYPAVAGPLALMNVDNAMTVLRRAKERGVHSVVFTDDTFNVPPERFERLLDAMIEADLGLTWYSFLRCQYLTEPMVAKMKASGCGGVFLGVESGSDAVLKNMKKGAVTRFYRDGIRWLKDAGILTVGAFVLGFPGETEETVEATRRFIEESGLDYYFIQPFFYVHLAPIHARAAEFGLTGAGLFWSHKTMNWRQATAHINRLFLEIGNATFIHPDYNLWEYVYLRSRGVGREEFLDYRRRINDLTRDQMNRFALA